MFLDLIRGGFCPIHPSSQDIALLEHVAEMVRFIHWGIISAVAAVVSHLFFRTDRGDHVSTFDKWIRFRIPTIRLMSGMEWESSGGTGTGILLRHTTPCPRGSASLALQRRNGDRADQGHPGTLSYFANSADKVMRRPGM